MLTENFLAATHAVTKPSAHASSGLKDVGIFLYEYQPHYGFRHGFKKSSVHVRCVAVSDTHIFAAQADRAVINVYNREKGNQEATVPFPDKVHSLVYADQAAILIIGSEDGKLVLWEVATGRVTATSAAHLQEISHVQITKNNDSIISASADSNIHIWSLSRIVSFWRPTTSYGNEEPMNAPISTFSKHRGSITAVATAHSSTSTNFVVSVSDDRACYIWDLQTCRVLRTLLLPEVAVSMVLDPADRAIYLGYHNAAIQHVDLLGSASLWELPVSSTENPAPMQLRSKDFWSQASTEVGAINCLALSYDGTTLVSGHESGHLIKWDVSKRRVLSDLADLHQPVTNLHMLTPAGLSQKPPYRIPAIVKPRLDLNEGTRESTVGLPVAYAMQVQVVARAREHESMAETELQSAFYGNAFPDEMIDDAVQAVLAKHTSADSFSVGAAPDRKSEIRVAQLQEQLEMSQRKLVALQKLTSEREERHRARMERREDIGAAKRAAYFTAKEKGQDGDAAMKPFINQEDMIDRESDEDVTGIKTTAAK